MTKHVVQVPVDDTFLRDVGDDELDRRREAYEVAKAAGSDVRDRRGREPFAGIDVSHHQGRATDVVAMSWSPDATRVATAGRDGTVRIWDPDRSSELARTEVQPGPLVLAWSPDATRVAMAGGDGTLRIWDLETGAEVARSEAGPLVAWARSPDGTGLATAGVDGVVRIWDLENGAEVARCEAGLVVALAWSPDGTRLATATPDGAVRIDSRVTATSKHRGRS